ncbi:MAG: CrcB family protein [Caldimicrobium sp.]
MSYFLTSGSDPHYRYLFVVGFLGAFTTLSSITNDTLFLYREGYPWLSLVKVFSNFFSLLAGVGGLALGNFLFYNES